MVQLSSIKTKLLIMGLVLGLVMAGVVGFVTPLLCRNVASSVMENDVDFTAKLLAENCALGMQTYAFDKGESLRQTLAMLQAPGQENVITEVSLFDSDLKWLLGLNSSPDKKIHAISEMATTNRVNNIEVVLPIKDSHATITGYLDIIFSKNSFINKINHFTRWMGMIGMVFLVVIFLLILWVTSTITRSIHLVVAKLKEIASGDADLTHRIDVRTKDELGSLAHWFNIFVEKIGGIVLQVRNGAGAIETSAGQIQTASHGQAKGSSEQSSAVNEASTTVKELAATASQIAQNAENVAKVAERSMAGMQEINIRVDTTAKKILRLGEKSQAIGNITKLIDDIAEQTNPLALNAAIEAARAGDAGRGFAVVAQEVRKLAERSSESTDEIRQLITEIQSEINATVIGIEDSLKWVTRGVEMIRETAGSAKEISIATQQQRTASEQTVQAMQNINAVTRQFTASTAQALSSAKTLSDLAHELKIVLAGFKLG
ncbi:MAG: HAMP domain-containing protein [Candidatus Omnitrophica bacterium]|nr:HAMP domain-containing protein [Candidatus Omnitrophota bacterium]